MKFWDLPGPSNFVGAICDSIRDGKCVIVALPEPVPRSIEKRLYDSLGDSGFFVDRLEYSTTQSPLQFLYSSYDLQIGNESRLTVDFFVKALGNQARVIFINNAQTGAKWGQWKAFIHEYESRSRSIPSHLRTVILLVARGIPFLEIPQPEPALAIHQWSGVVSSIDMLAYCGVRLLDSGVNVIQRPLIAQMLVSLSMWDVELAEMLLAADTKTLYKPFPLLKEYAVQRGWIENAEILEKCWESGTRDSFDGVESSHAAWYLAAGDKRKIESMVWRAQAAVLLPKIEMHRLELAPLICKEIKFPYTSGDYFFRDVNDLEIGNLAYLASDRKAKVPALIGDFARKLKELRNDLAHLRIVEEHRATDLQLLLPFDSTRR